jgi:hypothetical protein
VVPRSPVDQGAPAKEQQ